MISRQPDCSTDLIADPGADLTAVYLTGAGLTGAYLTGWSNSCTVLTVADLSGADLPDSPYKRLRLAGADLTGPDCCADLTIALT